MPGVEADGWRASEIRLAEIVFPHHCNHLGTLFGGQALAWMDKAAFLVSSRYSGHTTVTARSDRIDFKAPIRLGDTVEIRAAVACAGRSSMRVDVTLLVCGMPGQPPVTATTGEFVMVAVDHVGKPVAIAAPVSSDAASPRSDCIAHERP